MGVQEEDMGVEEEFILGLLDQAQHYLWTSRPKLTLHGPKIQGPNLFYLAQIQGLNYSKLL